jgi:RNA polymerase sigma-70 factor (ECF subfamily)
VTTETTETEETKAAEPAHATPQTPGLEQASADYVRLATAQLDSAYRLAGYLLGDGAAAQEAARAALIRAWQFWPELTDVERFPAWFERLVVQVCLARMGRRKPAADAAASPSADVFRSMAEDDEIARAVAKLAPQHRAVIVLRYWQDLPLDQVAERLGVPFTAAESRLYDALKALASELDASAQEASVR